MQTFLIDYADREYELPVSLGWNFSYGEGLPCDAFEISFVYDVSMLQMLQNAIRFRAVHEGETVFFGVVDEFEVSFSERGRTVTVCGRSLAALLLDNEAEAAELFGAGIDFIIENYVYPYGVTRVRKNASPPNQHMVVSSGSSCWKILEEFLWFGCGEMPRFSKDGVLILGAEKGKRLRVDAQTAVAEQLLRCRRYGVISETLVKNKSLGTSYLVQNTEFLNMGGKCRRIVNVPRNTRYDVMRATGNYQIMQSKEDEFMLSLTLPKLFAAFPGDIVELDYSATGLGGAFLVGKTNCFAWPDKAGTEIILTKREI